MAAFTRKSIMESFMKLLDERPLNKISIKDIVEDCGVNRNTFYYHFADVPDLVEAIVKAKTDRIMQGYHGISSLEECIEAAMQLSLEHKRALLHIYNSANKELFDRYLNRVAQRTVTEYIEHNAVPYNITPEDKEAVVFYYKSLIVGFVVEWLSGGMKYDLTEKLARVCLLFDGTMESIMAKCEREAENK